MFKYPQYKVALIRMHGTLVPRNFTIAHFTALHFKTNSVHENHVGSTHINSLHATLLIYTHSSLEFHLLVTTFLTRILKVRVYRGRTLVSLQLIGSSF
jgi:hypothetical protein